MISASRPVQRPLSEILPEEGDLLGLEAAELRLNDLDERRADAAHRLEQAVDWISRIEGELAAGEGVKAQLDADQAMAQKQRTDHASEVEKLNREEQEEVDFAEGCKDRIQEAQARAVKGSVWMVSSLVPPLNPKPSIPSPQP